MKKAIETAMAEQMDISTGYARGYAETDDKELKYKYERHMYCWKILKSLLPKE